MKVGLVYDPIYLKHDTGTHVENSRRLMETIDLLERSKTKDKLVIMLVFCFVALKKTK